MSDSKVQKDQAHSAFSPLIRASYGDLGSEMRKVLPEAGRIMIVGDDHTVPLYAEEVSQALSAVCKEVHVYMLPSGEAHKQLRTVERLLVALEEMHFDRHDVVAALGGGVVGDLAGFAAAIYLRGISVIQIPTTLLAQVDSSIGGKTGVDLDGYKNMVGAFHLPALIYTNPSVLSTLDARQFAAGMGEVIKTALLGDRALFHALRASGEAVMRRESEALLKIVSACAEIKAGIVARDPKEKGERALLNLGHTIGHAIEKYMSFSLLHGECVSIGLAAAAQMSAARGLLTADDVRLIRDTCRFYELPVSVAGADAERIFEITKSDKKMKGGQIRFVLLKAIGEAFYTDDVTDEELRFGIRSVLEDGGMR